MYTREKDLHEINLDFICPFNSYIENVKDGGCYYLPPEICKNIIITIGVSGIHTPKAIQIIRRNIGVVGDMIEDVIPAMRYINNEFFVNCAGELAECLVCAAGVGKGIEIANGYPKIFVFKVI